MRLRGEIQHGIYKDEWEDVPEDELTENLGAFDEGGASRGPTRIDRDQQSSGSSDGDGSGDSSGRGGLTEDSFESDALIRQRVAREIKHAPVRIKRIAEPFGEDQQAILFTRIEARRMNHKIPRGFGLRVSDENYSPYNPKQEIHIGAKKKSQIVTLPHEIWLPCCELWVIAVWELTRIKEELGIGDEA